MPRSGGGVYSLPAGSIVTDGVDDILAAQHNDPLNDLALDMNTARPVVAGGTGATTASAALVNLGLTATAAEINVLDGVTASTAELNILDGVTATTTEINYIDGVTSAIQTQLDGKQALDTDLTQIAGVTRARGTLLRGGAAAWEGVALGAAGSVLTSDGTDAIWSGESYYFRLDSAHAGTNGTSAQNFFPQAVTLEASTVYQYELVVAMTKSAGTTLHGISTLYGGTATRNNTFRIQQSSGVNTAATGSSALLLYGYTTSGGAVDTTASVFSAATANYWYREVGSFSVNGAGTWFPAYQLSAAPGGAWSTVAGSFVRLRKIGAAGSNSSQGPWA